MTDEKDKIRKDMRKLIEKGIVYEDKDGELKLTETGFEEAKELIKNNPEAE